MHNRSLLHCSKHTETDRDVSTALSLSAKIDHYRRRFLYEAAALAETHRNLAAACYMIKIDRNRGSWTDDARCNHNFLAEESESTFGGRF